MIRTFIITLPEKPQRKEKAIAHLKERGLHTFQFFDGIHAERAGLSTLHPYNEDHPGTDFRMGFAPTGIWLSHVMLWSALNLLHDDHFLIFEDDVKIPEDWHTRFVSAMNDTPPDFDMLYVGSCCCTGRPQTQIENEVWDVRYPQCTHAYVVARKALPVMLSKSRKCWAPVDISLMKECHPHLKVFTVLPRIFSQWDTEIPV